MKKSLMFVLLVFVLGACSTGEDIGDAIDSVFSAEDTGDVGGDSTSTDVETADTTSPAPTSETTATEISSS